MRSLAWLLLTFTWLACCADAVAQTPASAGGVRRALLIGINDYRSVPTLQGSLNDIAAVEEVLVTRWNFARRDITRISDTAATRAGILAAIDQLVREAQPADVVYVHYSGHGSQVEDLNSDEADGLDETLVPQDGRGGDIPDITDDELEARFARLRSTSAVVVLDSCHSGTATRSVAIRTRSLPRDTRIDLYRGGATTTRAIVPVLSSRFVVMSAAAADQEALDGPVDGRYHGFFTYSLVRSISASPAQASPRDILAGVGQQLNRIKAQFGRASMPEPQLEAPPAMIDQPIMPAAATARIAWVETQAADGDLLLRRAAALGAAVGSTWLVYPAGESKFVPGRALAAAVVTRIAGDDALAKVTTAGPQVPAGGRAIPASAPGAAAEVAIRVRDVPEARRQEIEAALSRDIRNVKLVGPFEPAQFVVDADQDKLRLMAADGLQLVAAFDANQAGWSNDLSRQVVRTGTAAELLSLDNPSSLLRVFARVAGAAPFATRGVAVVPDVQAARFRIRRAGEPRTPANSLQLEVAVNADAYITIVDVDSEGAVNVLFPNDHQNPDFLPEGQLDSGRTARIPDDLRSGNRAGFHWDYAPPRGVDTLRVFASSDLATARLIRARARAIQAGGTAQPFDVLRRDLAELLTRGIAIVPEGGGPAATAAAGDWTAAEVIVQVDE